MKSVALAFVLLSAATGAPQQQGAPAASVKSIKIGNVMPYTGRFSEYGSIGRAEAAYFEMVNKEGGVKGHKIDFISLDSQSDLNVAIDLAHHLVDQDQVLFTVSIWGTPVNMAIRPYMNERKVPQLFVAATEAAFDDPSHFPWTMGFQATRRTEGSEYAKYILQGHPDAKVGILYPADRTGEEWLKGVREGFGRGASSLIVKQVSFNYSDPATVDAGIAALKDSGANVFLNLIVGRLCEAAIRKAYALDWRPMQFIPNASLPIVTLLDAADRAQAVGVIANARSKDWLRPRSGEDPEVRAYLDWMAAYNPKDSIRDPNSLYGYEVAQTVVHVLKKCGDDLSRANVMKQAAHLDLQLGMLRPGIRLTTSPTNYQPINRLFLVRFDGQNWISLGSSSLSENHQ